MRSREKRAQHPLHQQPHSSFIFIYYIHRRHLVTSPLRQHTSPTSYTSTEMAHRGLIREVFQIACIALLFGQSEKEDVPSPPVYININNPQGYLRPKLVPLQPSPAEPTGLLPLIFSMVTMLTSWLGEEYL